MNDGLRKNQRLLIILGILIFAALLGFTLKKPAPPGELSGIVAVSLWGKIVTLEGNELTIDVPEVSGVGIPADHWLRMREILVLSNTFILERLAKPQEQYQRELRVYEEQKKSGATQVIPPLPVIEATLTLGDLRVGNTLMVTGENNADLRYERTIRAAEIVRAVSQ